MKRNTDIGIFFTSGAFSNPVKQEATSALVIAKFKLDK